MTPKQLLLPRYKVIDKYPFNVHFKVGDVITLDQEDEEGKFATVDKLYSTKTYRHSTTFYEEDLNRYPNIFRPLEWWEERAAWDMPKFLRHPRHGYIVKAEEWQGVGSFYFGKPEGGLSKDKATLWLPATEEEYNEYINSLTKNQKP